MKKILLVLLFEITTLTVNAQVNPRNHYVKAHITKNGTYVSGHYATNRNYTNRDNYSTYPNTNPYTGKEGTITPDNNYSNFSRRNNSFNSNSYNGTSSSYSSPNYSNNIQTGSRGGHYYINKNGNKTYIK